MEKLRPVRKDKISNQVFDQLLLQIIEGAWAPKTKIPSENELSSVLHVSRVSIRSALEKLEALGLIETRHGEGSFVRKLSADSYMNSLLPMIALDKVDLLDVMEYRKIIECGIMALVVENALPADIETMNSIITAMEKTQDDQTAFAVEDMRFHVELARIAGNSILIKVQEILGSILRSSMIDIVPVVGTDNGIYFHKKILEAIEAKDKQKAESLMKSHLDVNINSLKEWIKKE